MPSPRHSLKSSKDHLMKQLNDPASQHARQDHSTSYSGQRASQMQAIMQPCAVPGMAASASGMPLRVNCNAPPATGTAPAPHRLAPDGTLIGAPSSLWATDLWDCFEDMHSCITTLLCPSVAHGMVQSRLDGQPWFAPCCLYYFTPRFFGADCLLLGMQRRATLRSKYGLPEEPCNDFCMDWCCSWCAICQEWRELDRRGVPAAIGPF